MDRSAAVATGVPSGLTSRWWRAVVSGVMGYHVETLDRGCAADRTAVCVRVVVARWSGCAIVALPALAGAYVALSST